MKEIWQKREIALVIPCFNEEHRLRINDLDDFISCNRSLIDFYFVDDGSSDSTSLLVKTLVKSNPQNVFLLGLTKNRGKGNAVRAGILLAKQKEYSYYGFIDGDLEIPLEQILKMYKAVLGENKSMAISVRSLNQKVKFYQPRTVISVLVVIIANYIIRFKVPIKDSQCGCKLFKSNIIETCFRERFQTQWLFDLEIFMRLRNAISYAREEIQEVPLNHLNKVENSRIKLTRNLRILRQLWEINTLYNKKHND